MYVIVIVGPFLGFQVVDVEVQLHDIKSAHGTSLPMLTAAVAQAVQHVIREAHSQLLEPMMLLEVGTLVLIIIY